jgi:hypothetical protein
MIVRKRFVSVRMLRTWIFYCSVVLLFVALSLPCNVQAKPTFVNAADPNLP